MNNMRIDYREYVRRNQVVHAKYDGEIEFYTYIKNGNLAKVRELCSESLLTKEGLGVLSKDRLRNIKYHFIVTTAMVARHCIEAGMELSVAYSLSDYYINKIDTMKTAEEVDLLHPVMCQDYAKRMRNLYKKKICSKPVAFCMDYICDNLHNNISLKQLADLCELNPSYLSRLFKLEADIGINHYIQAKRIETAANMLAYTDYSVADISSTLSFADQSYFGKIFKKHYKITPLEYRRQNYRNAGVNNL